MLELNYRNGDLDMLVLSRKVGESIILKLPNDEQVRICLTEYQGQQTRVGIEAPEAIKIIREELLYKTNEYS